jgi:hypothetical protein
MRLPSILEVEHFQEDENSMTTRNGARQIWIQMCLPRHVALPAVMSMQPALLALRANAGVSTNAEVSRCEKPSKPSRGRTHRAVVSSRRHPNAPGCRLLPDQAADDRIPRGQKLDRAHTIRASNERQAHDLVMGRSDGASQRVIHRLPLGTHYPQWGSNVREQ